MTPFVQSQLTAIRALLAAHEELEADDTLRMDAIEGETQALEALDWLIRKDCEEAAFIKAQDELAALYTARAGKAEARKEAYRVMMQALLNAMGVEKIKRPAGAITVNPGKLSVRVENADELPQGFYEPVRKPLAKEIRKALEAGEEVPGASLVQGNPFLTVR